MAPNNGEARGSLRAENRIKRRFARFKQRKDLRTTDPLMAELALAQIDATLSVSHAIQELSDHVDNVAYHMPTVRVGNTTFLKSTSQADIESIRYSLGIMRDSIMGLRDRLDSMERNIGALAPATAEAKDDSFPPDGNLPWWAFWRGW